MKIPKHLLIGFISFIVNVVALNAQTVTIKGEVSGADDLENIHVINKTSKTFTITNSTGQFEIPAKAQDTLVFSSIQYSALEVVVNVSTILNKSIKVNLEAHINALDEVVVGKILTGNLLLDVGNSTAKPEINFYDVGIPGYQGPRASKTERRLSAAQSGIIGAVVNGISGETKRLKAQAEFVKKDELIHEIRKRLSDDFFSVNPLSEFKQMDFWYFCAEDLQFSERCKGKRDIVILAFLNEKYEQYVNNLKLD